MEETSELEEVPRASPARGEASLPTSRVEQKGGTVITAKEVAHLRQKITSVSQPGPAQARKRSRASDSEEDMYFSPLDSSSEVYFIGLLLITLASIATRLYKIDEPKHVA